MSEAIQSPMIYRLLAQAMEKTKAIAKDSLNKQQGFKYRGVDAVMNALHPIFAELGIVVVPEVLTQTREERKTSSGGNLLYSILHMSFHFCAPDASCLTATVVGEGMDSGDKASNKAMSVAYKYACFQVLCIPTEDDPDQDTPPRSEPSQKAQDAPKSYCCVKCGKPFTGFTTKDGKQFNAGQEYHMRETKLGSALCDACKPQS